MIDAYIWIGVWVVILIMCIVELGKVESRLAEDRINKMFEYLKERRGEKMADYISRQKAIEAIMGLPNCPNGYSDTYDKECIIGTLDEVPTADVRAIVEEYCKKEHFQLVSTKKCFWKEVDNGKTH